MAESVIPAVLLRALSEHQFVGHPLRKESYLRRTDLSQDATSLQDEG